MKKLTSYFKTLLVMAALVGGVNSAWAQDTYESVYTRAAVSDWTDADKTDWNASSAVAIDATNGLGANANLTATYVSKTFTITDGAKVKYEVDWTYATATGRTGNWNWIQFGSFLRIAVNSSYNMQVSTDAGANWNTTTLGYYYNGTYTKHIEVIFDTQLKTIESFNWDGEDKTSLVEGTYNSATFNSVSTGFVRGGSVNWTLNNYITTIAVSQAEQAAAAAATYTINYTFGGSTIKSETGESVAGGQITAEGAITVDDVKYLCTDAAAPSLTLEEGENTLNVPVRLPYTATLKVTTTIGSGEPATVTKDLIETDDKDCTWSYAYPYCVESDGVYYVADVTKSFGETGTFTNGETIEKTVTYSTTNSNIVYYGEPNQTEEGKEIAYSNGNTAYITGGVTYDSDKVIRLGTLPAGTYMLLANVTGDEKRNVVLGDCSDTSVFPTAIVTFTGTGLQSQIFTLTEDTPISISGKDQGSGKFNQSSTLDYIMLKKIVSMSIVGDFSENGWEPAQGIAMTQNAENPAIWTAVVEDYEITSDKLNYEYKAVANGNWSDYVLPSGDNQNYNFDYDGAGAGTYKLTFTVNTTDNSVELAIEKKQQEKTSFTVSYVDNDGWGNIHAYTYGAETLGDWPGTAMTEAGEVNGKKVYTITFSSETAPRNIIFNNGSNEKQTADLDFVDNSLYGIAWPEATITEAGYATYCSPYALDFTDVEGLTAYVAKVEGTEVTFTEVEKVPANTGVLLKGNAATYSIKTLATAPAVENAFVGVTAETKAPAGSFVLMNSAKGVGFYKTNNEFTVGANTAYLPATASAREFIGLGDETTGIVTVGRDSSRQSKVFNLNGQRVVKAQKGLYIINGKKVFKN